MTGDAEWPGVEEVSTDRLTLEPLQVDHADEMAVTLADPELHRYIGGGPATAEELRARYALQVAGGPEDRSERWLNWIVRRKDDGRAAGYVQATVTGEAAMPTAEVAWVIGTGHQGRGFATEAAVAMVGWLRSRGVGPIVAHVHPEHAASMAVARAIGLRPTADVVEGETRWAG